MSHSKTHWIRVWDPLVRIFHWSLVIFFFTAYLTEDEFQSVHIWAGYAVAGLVTFRIVWGLIGSRHARFTSFVKHPSTVIAYCKQIFQGNPDRHLGHNPAGGAMIIALLLSLVATTICGMALLSIDGGGPLAGTFFAHLPEDPLKEVHEFFANATIILVVLHVGGVILASRQHKENLVVAMVNGRKRSEPEATPAE
ncbi:cytochrome B [Hahella sp. CCB-MM4]|uniref:cytochrome b/b6 domain-containing protein n=1 Tax=Hahella sp. (strain CCB-MM4) TaxID=1926491 RepID=UPI000B9BD38F|nr:cytochrome b/b6 domain-containing protein [Hahella sp. CCB-MM4]OZG73232.1 cytochrome B [Hahella sp. CCB-MM4]